MQRDIPTIEAFQPFSAAALRDAYLYFDATIRWTLYRSPETLNKGISGQLLWPNSLSLLPYFPLSHLFSAVISQASN